jgi:CheY-like chemotaxis protein
LGTTPDVSRVARVLVAEDDEDSRELLTVALRQIGADVVTVPDGGRFLVTIASYYRDGSTVRAPDLIVTDVRMPICSGLSVFEALRAAHWRIPVIVITGLDTPAVRRSVERYGATFMLKPIDVLAFQRAAQRLMAVSTP